MGLLDKNVWSKKRWRKIRETHSILSFALIFLISFFILIFAPNAIKNIPNQIIISYANSYLNSNVNENIESRAYSQYSYNDTSQIASFTAVYRQTLSSHAPGAQKNMSVNMNLEYYLPMVLLLSLVIAYKIKIRTKLLKILIGELILFIYLFFKIIATALDNYNYPDAAIIKLDGIWGGCVYYYNYFLNLVGTSPNFLIPVAIFAILFYKEIDKK
jgi:hypothetical protein